MPSSPADPAVLTGLAASYDAALAALLQGDLERVACMLDQADALLADRLADRPAAASDAAAALHTAATAAQVRLLGALRTTQQAVLDELGRVRHGRRALAGYSDPTRGIGEHVQSRA